MRPICQINLIYTKTPSHVQLHQLTTFEIFQLLYVDDGAFPFPDRNKLTAGINLIQSHFARFGLEIHIGREERVPRPRAYSFLLPSSSMTMTHFLPHELPKDALMGTRGCHTLPPRLTYAPTCESQKVPASPEKMPSMTPSQRLPRLTSPLAVYGDTIHQNDGTHLDGGIGVAEVAKWQRLHLRARMCIPVSIPVPAGPPFPEYRIFHGISGFRRNTRRN